MRKIIKILITGGELRNKGAQAMSFATIDSLKTMFPESEIFLISDSDSNEENNNLYKFKIVRSATNAFSILYKTGGVFKLLSLSKKVTKKRIKEMDALYKDADYMFDISGYALGSAWGAGRSISYLFKIILAKAYGIKMYILPQSMGPLDYKGLRGQLVNLLLKKYLKYPEKIFVRENEGYALLLKKYGLKNVVRCNDLVLTNKDINLDNIYKETPFVRESNISEGSVGIIPNMKNYKYGNKDALLEIYRGVIDKLLSYGRNVYLLRHAVEDAEFCRDIKAIFVAEERVILLDYEISCIEFNELAPKFDYFIASRYHSVVHAYKNCVPCIILGWATKYRELAELFEQSDFIFDVRRKLNNAELLMKVELMNENFDQYSENIRDILAKVQKENVFDIIGIGKKPRSVKEMDKNLCVSCGFCAGVCPNKCIKFEFENDRYIPKVDASQCTKCGLCTDVCSACGENYETYKKYSAGEDVFSGNYISSYTGWATDERVRLNSTSGGVITALVYELLEDESFDCAFLVNDFAYSKMIQTRKFVKGDNLKLTSKSRYIPVSHQQAVEYILKNRQEHVILCGTPCAIHNFLNVIDRFHLNRENYLLIGLFCDKTESNNIYSFFESLSDKDVKELHFRNKEQTGWPGDVKLKYSDGTEKFYPAMRRMELKEYFQLERCLYCLDKLNIYCDISVGDNYIGKNRRRGDKGSNSVIIRTDMGMQSIQKAKNRLELVETNIEDILSSQKIDDRRLNIIFSMILEKRKGIFLNNVPNNIEKSSAHDIQKYKKILRKIEIGRTYVSKPYKLKNALCVDRLNKKLNRIIGMGLRGLKRWFRT